MVTHPSDFRKIAKEAAYAASEKKAVDIVILDVRKDSDVADYMIIAGGESAPQLRAIYEGVVAHLQDLGIRLLRQEGHVQDRWIALDYGGLLVHILLSEAREFYRLEHMWENSKVVHLAPSRGEVEVAKRLATEGEGFRQNTGKTPHPRPLPLKGRGR